MGRITTLITLLVVGMAACAIEDGLPKYGESDQGGMLLCRDDLIFKMPINETVASNAPVSIQDAAYIAVKQFPQYGYDYFLLVRSEASSKLVTFRWGGGGLRARDLSRKEGERMWEFLLDTDLSNYKSWYGEPRFHNMCGFVQINQPPDKVDLYFRNISSDTDSDDSLARLQARVETLLEEIYADFEIESAEPWELEEPSELTIREHEEKLKKDVFFELNK